MTARKQKKRSDSPNSSHSGFAASDSTNLSTTPPTHASNTTTTSDLSSADGVLKEDASSGVIESPKLPLVYGKSVAGLQGSEKAKALPHIVVCVPNHKDRITVTVSLNLLSQIFFLSFCCLSASATHKPTQFRNSK
eukprot:c12442_g1_i1.p1 GENE.c12442_g1_i1~~c12442_g1_i1.p1  ORF type:complete len:136 (-),score=33.85 c12442_g1_i1:125-532(-)